MGNFYKFDMWGNGIYNPFSSSVCLGVNYCGGELIVQAFHQHCDALCVEFVVGSHPCYERFISKQSSVLLFSKTKFYFVLD